MTIKPKELIGASFGWGAAHHEAQMGPKILKEMLKEEKWGAFLEAKVPYLGKKIPYEERLAQVVDFVERLAKEVEISSKTHFPIVLGGDHSIAIGTWSGLVKALQAQGQFGLIWIDAHMDSHTPKTTPSSNIHGMPLAALLGAGESKLVNLMEIGAKLNPQHVVLIGVRSFEPQEAEFLKENKVKIYFIEEVLERGFKTVFYEALDRISHQTKGFGISLDVDAIDPILAPGTGAPVANGITDITSVMDVLKEIKDNPLFMALEIAEFDPTRDLNQKTAILIKRLLSSLLSIAP